MASDAALTRRVFDGIREARLPLALLAVVVAAPAVAYLLVAHRVTGASLGYSLRRATGDGYSEPCRRAVDGWYCPNGAPEGVAYRITVRGHCWRARSVSVRPPSPRRLSGCVGLGDQLRLQGLY